MNIEDKKALITLVISNLKYRVIEKNDFEITAAIAAAKISTDQIQYMQNIGLSVVPYNDNNKSEILVFGLSKLLIDDKNTVEGEKIQNKIVEDYKNKNFTVKYNNFMMLGASLGTLGLAATTALMIATSPLTSIVLGGATLGLACYDNSKHFKKIMAQQLENVLDRKFITPVEKISLLREVYNSNKLPLPQTLKA